MSAYRAQPVQTQGLSFFPVSEKKIAFSKCVLHFRFMLMSGLELVVQTCPKLPAWTVLGLPLRYQASAPDLLSVLSHLLKSHSADLHLATGTAAKRVPRGIQSGRLPRVKSLTVEL